MKLDLENTSLANLPSTVLSRLSSLALLPYHDAEDRIRFTTPGDLHSSPADDLQLTSAFRLIGIKVIALSERRHLLPASLAAPPPSRIKDFLRATALDRLTPEAVLALAAHLRLSSVTTTTRCLDRLPFLLRADDTLSKFPAKTPLYRHRYSPLLPTQPELFLRRDLEHALGRSVDAYLTPFDLDTFRSRLKHQMPEHIYRGVLATYFVWDPKHSDPVTEEWILEVWRFLDQCLNPTAAAQPKTPLSGTPISPLKSPIFPLKSPTSPLKTSRYFQQTSVSVAKSLEALNDWYLIPAVQQRGNTKV